MSDEIKMGVYLCTGCDLGDRLDVKQLEMTATRDGKAEFCKTSEFLCSRAGIQMIQQDIDNNNVNHVVIAACSLRSRREAFRLDRVSVTRANLREGVIWVRPDDEEMRETTQEMADDYMRMACAESRFCRIPAPGGEQSLNKTLLVVGGGVTGLTAALESARAGYQVQLIEKSNQLGGWATQLYKCIPTRSPYAEPADSGVNALIEAVSGHENITVHLNSRVAATSGAPGRFIVEINLESGSTSRIEIGAIVQATGFNLYDIGQIPEFSHSQSPDIVTNMELEALVSGANGGIINRPSNHKPVTSVVFVQNAGQNSDQPGHLPYHSGIGDLVSIKQSLYFKSLNPDCDTTIIFNNLCAPGAAGEDFYRAGQKAGIIFTKGIVATVSVELEVQFHDVMLDEEVTIRPDLVVLDLGMVPNSGPDPYATNIEADSDQAPRTRSVSVESILNLDYRQGTDLPHLKNGFTDSHFICFPYETRRTGIYAAGPVRRPMDMHQAREDATGAAMKAIQALENARSGRAAHPRSGDLSYPIFRKEGCTQCRRCTVECPFGAINEDEKRYPVFNESRCRRCGICMGACPVRVISFENYSIDTVGQQIKHVDIPDEFDEKPRILVLACENDAYPALDLAAQSRLQYSAFARIVPVRCLGSVNTIWITDALNSGFDGVILMGCQKGDDYQCHFVKGSELAHTRMSKIVDTLQLLSLEAERVATYEVAITDIQRVPGLINDMAETIEKIGMSPFKF